MHVLDLVYVKEGVAVGTGGGQSAGHSTRGAPGRYYLRGEAPGSRHKREILRPVCTLS